MDSLKGEARPLQRKDIKDFILRDSPRPVSSNQLGVVLHNMVKEGILTPVKLKGIPTFYAHPDWVEDDQLKPGYNFDPIFKTFKIDIDAQENNPVGVPNT